MIWFALFIPLILLIVVFVLFRQKITWWEPFIPFVSTLLLTIMFKYIGQSCLTHDIEFLQYHVVKISYYEDWDEWITQTCTRTCCCDSKGENCETETYDCSYRDYHPQYWTITLNSGEEIDVSHEYYVYLYKKFGSRRTFVNMHRHYYTKDGNKYESYYPNTYESFEDYVVNHAYKNKVKASKSIFNFPNVDTTDIRYYGLYKYTKLQNYKLPPILSKHPISSADQKQFEYINGMLGMNKQIRVWICLFENGQSRKAALMQKSYWKGGNKNEFVICIGLDPNKNVNWAEVFTWGENKILDIEVRDYLQDLKGPLNYTELAKFLYPEIIQHWKRKSFKDFEYISIEPPLWSVITTYIVSLIVCAGIFFWIINND